MLRFFVTFHIVLAYISNRESLDAAYNYSRNRLKPDSDAVVRLFGNKKI